MSGANPRGRGEGGPAVVCGAGAWRGARTGAAARARGRTSRLFRAACPPGRPSGLQAGPAGGAGLPALARGQGQVDHPLRGRMHHGDALLTVIEDPEQSPRRAGSRRRPGKAAESSSEGVWVGRRPGKSAAPWGACVPQDRRTGRPGSPIRRRDRGPKPSEIRRVPSGESRTLRCGVGGSLRPESGPRQGGRWGRLPGHPGVRVPGQLGLGGEDRRGQQEGAQPHKASRLRVVMSAIRAKDTPRSAARRSATWTTQAGSLGLPRWGMGAR